MKLRNQLLALACMAFFVAAGYLYVSAFVVQKPFGIIVFVSDGLVARQLTMARLYDGGADHRLALESFSRTALLRNDANDFAVPDDAAVATALATGIRTNHRHLGVNPKGQPLKETIADLVRKKGRAIGVVTNGSITDPVPAVFYAQAADARETEPLALQLLNRARPEVILGGGAIDFLPADKGGRRKDKRDLVEELRQRGCEIVRTKSDLENVGTYPDAGLVGLFSSESLAFSKDIESGSQQPSLADMVRRAVRLLERNPKGYLLIVDASLVGTAAERNEGERMIAETVALDRAVATAREYAGEKSLILAIGKHATGGLSLNGFPLRQAHGVALLGNSPEGYPYLTWATGPNGPAAPGAPSAVATPAPETAAPAPASNPRNEPAAYAYPSALNAAEDVLALGEGIGSERLHGILDNTVIFRILRDAL
jgi:alkaline phosphatase